MIEEIVGLQEMEKLYEIDAYFAKTQKVSKEPLGGDQNPFFDNLNKKVSCLEINNYVLKNVQGEKISSESFTIET